jgi:HEAT repeat protein/cyclophilin family peptidyl-prolyl cis-trans isomerase
MDSRVMTVRFHIDVQQRGVRRARRDFLLDKLTLRTPRPLRCWTYTAASAALALSALASGCASAPPAKAPIFTYEQKLAWIVRLEDQRVLHDPQPAPPPQPVKKSKQKIVAAPVPDLLPLLADPEPRVRRRAAIAVGRVGLPSAVPSLLPLLKDPEPEVRQMAAFALGLIGDRAAVVSLEGALSDTDARVRGRAAEALGLIGDPSAGAAISAMARAAAAAGQVSGLTPDDERATISPEAIAFELGIAALVRLKSFDHLRAAVLDPAGQPIGQWWPIAFALSRIENPGALTALRSLARSSGRYTRAFAVRGLGILKDEASADLLLSMIEPAKVDAMGGIAAIRALAQIGTPKAVAALVPLVRAPKVEPNVRLEAVAALGVLRAPHAMDALQDVAADPWPAMRAQALRSMAAADPDGFVFALSGLDPDPHWSVRAAVADALAGLPLGVAQPRLDAMLGDTDQRVIAAALTALAKMKAPSAEGALRTHLTADDVVVRMTAARELGAMKPADGVQLFSDAYRRWSSDDTYLARAAALTSLAPYGQPALATLKQALADREWAVRLKAVDLLKTVDPSGDYALQIRPAPGTPAVPYDSPDVLAPKFSPHLYLDTSKGLIEIELAMNEAPLTAQTIMALARKGFYTGVAFHRVVPNFVVQAGDPRGDGEGGPGFTIRDEINELPYVRGTVGMALDWRDTGGSQLFITHSPQPHLDARYTVFGRVVKGMEIVDALQQWDTIDRVRVWDGITLTGK